MVLMKTGLPELINALKALCFPPVCLACKLALPARREFLFCAACAERIETIVEPLCTCCGRPFPSAAGGNHLCSLCLTNIWHFSQARALILYEDPVRQAIHSFKYSGKMAALHTFGLLYQANQRIQKDHPPDLILPVPLHGKRLRERGFNQALLLAQAFFPLHRPRIRPDILMRTRATTPQTGLSGDDRRRNVRKAFEVRERQHLAGKTVLLVDDVFTTGTTVNECAKVLRQAGCLEVRVLTLARVREMGE